MKKLLATSTAIALTALGLLVAASPAQASSNTATAPCYTPGIDAKAYSTGVGDAIYQVVYTAGDVAGCAKIASVNRVLPAEFASVYGGKFSTWGGAKQSFRQLAGSSDVFAVTTWDSTRTTTAQKLSLQGWLAAGAPKPTVAKTVPGVAVIKYGSGDELFVKSSNSTTKLTFAQWAALGYPRFVQDYVGMNIFKVAGQSTVYVGDAEFHNALSFDEWAQLGYPTPRTVASMNAA
ncbi:hypothetical protein JT358_00985 [Micrococcales bacterium 31B]|nr:hypothetical protein [Micrococcales bacterium 31B]